jgi:aminoglycoside phosphotransferase (APT) family kinase protein
MDLDPRLLGWLVDAALPGRRIADLQPLPGGHSTSNAVLVTDTGERLVLRRYPGRDSCAVEAALAARLAGRVPVPAVVAVDPTGAGAGEPVLLSRFVPGTPVSRLLPELAGSAAGALGGAVGAVLAGIGEVSMPRPGFFDGPDLMPGPPGAEPTADLPVFVDRCLAETERAASYALTAAERDGLRALAHDCAPLLVAVRGAHRLVHSDFNPKNLLAVPDGAGWRISAVLDWEYAFSSTPLFDVGNMLRFEADQTPAYNAGVVAGYRGAGGQLPDGWRAISRALDLFALADLLTRPPGHPYRAKAVAAIRRRLAGPPGARGEAG